MVCSKLISKSVEKSLLYINFKPYCLGEDRDAIQSLHHLTFWPTAFRLFWITSAARVSSKSSQYQPGFSGARKGYIITRMLKIGHFKLVLIGLTQSISVIYINITV